MRAEGAPSAKRRRVQGSTRGKRSGRIIAENKGERISAYVTPGMRAFWGINANKVASEIGTQIRWICPIQGFYPSWKSVDSTLKDAILQVVRDKIKVTENEVEGTELVEEVFHEKTNLPYKDWKWRMNDFYTKTLDAGLDAYQHPFQEMPTDDWKYLIDHVFKDPKRKFRKKAGKLNRGCTLWSYYRLLILCCCDDYCGNEGNGNEGRKKLDYCDLYEASHRLRDTNEWIDTICQEKHVYLANLRLKEVGTDVLITAYEPILINPLSESASSVGAGLAAPAAEFGRMPMAEVFKLAVSRFKVNDWGLFGNATGNLSASQRNQGCSGHQDELASENDEFVVA
ncbi:hypothetical protein RHMOL_Rhmol12G0075300 [Rhododendron molle]|uniref:Uncharacterized protein n=1 Tax=Rhododendron molle TaxID=49168 RepID=A0ACC0LGP2_RHOML|nr:hypothetical protein RHMOL_Rhmol12G0075300 [Rhododendron molle]